MSKEEVDLTLRTKVAGLDGWTEIIRLGSRSDLLAGKHPQKRGNTSPDYFSVPAYEVSFDAILEACDRHEVLAERFSLVDHIKGVQINAVYADTSTGMAAGGKTNEIALCNLFVAVMESRLAEQNFGSQGEQIIERINTQSPFTRKISRQIKEKALRYISASNGTGWKQTLEDLAIAADRVDAMLARQELDEGVRVE